MRQVSRDPRDSQRGSVLKRLVRRVPGAEPIARRVHRALARWSFAGSESFWEQRYREGGDSGAGSYGKFAQFKAEVLNGFVAAHDVQTVIEFGCGDGNQLGLARYPRYSGYDVSESAIQRCRTTFAGDSSKQFHLIQDYHGERAELALSLDVIFHLVEDSVFDRYMRTLVAAATRFVIVYASNATTIESNAPHVRHRVFTDWMQANASEWRLVEHIPNRYPYFGDHTTGSFADFYVYAR